ncbi:MAG: hypothetical protein NC240_10460 [Clostridium sp.]|nr:hypothetical protein [Clostridium sp.]
MKCFACGNEIGERNVCPICGTPAKNVLCSDVDVSYVNEDATGIMYENTIFQKGIKPQVKKPVKQENKENLGQEELGEKKTKGASVIPNFVMADKYDDKKRKKKIKRIVIFILFTVILIAAVVITVIIILKEKKYLAGLPAYAISYYDSKNGISYQEDKSISYIYKGQQENLDIATDGSGIVYLDGDSLVAMQQNETSEIAVKVVEPYKVSPDVKSVLYGVENNGKVDVYLYKDGTSTLVREQLDNLKDIVVSENGDYFAFLTTWTYQEWKEDHQIPEGGEYITNTVYDIYSVSPYGEDKFRIEIENEELKLNYITNIGNIYYSNCKQNELSLETSGEDSSLCGSAFKLMYYDTLNKLVVVTDDRRLVLCDLEGSEQKLIATEVDDVYYVYSHSGFCEYEKLEESSENKSDSIAVVYTKGNKVYYNNLADADDTTHLFNGDASALRIIDEDSFYYENNGLYKYTYKDGRITSTLSDQYIYNKSGRGYVYLQDGRIMYVKKKKAKEICAAQEIKMLVGNSVYYVMENKLYKVNLKGKPKPELLFDNNIDVKIHYK